MEMIYFLLAFVFFLVLFLGLIIGIAYLASSSRRKKQNAILEQLPANTDFHAILRYNRNKKQDEVLKLKAFEGSGVLYVIGDTAYFRSTLGFETQFDLKSSRILWEGENLANGLLKWFSIANAAEKFYFNVDTGIFIFHLNKKKLTTFSIYDRLRQIQAGYTAGQVVQN